MNPAHTSARGKLVLDVQAAEAAALGVLEPNVRIKNLSDQGNSVEVDSNIPPRRYYRSGLEMVRMANVYLEEGSLENAFILYMKFMTLFLEKIRHHPDFSVVSVTDRAINSQKLREVMPKAEKLKARLLSQYEKEYERYLIDQKKRNEERELERHKQEKADEERRRALAHRIENGMADPVRPVAPVFPPAVPDVEYPDLAMGKTDARSHSPTADHLRPSVDRNTKPASLLSPSLHNKLGLRDVVVPARLMDKFLILAKNNTDQSVETCGILAGKLNHDQLIISHLLIPKQQGTPDSCLTQNEEEIFDYQDQHDLITLGWIHTHPTQTAFLSSVDLHTHCSYQMMMPEALAIVCAPRYKENAFFTLTPSYGLSFIGKCRQSGFHPHPTEPPLFMKAEHAKIDNNAVLEVVDLRSGR